MKYLISAMMLVVIVSFCNSSQAQMQDLDIEISKIWDQAPHNAFTDIIRFNDKFYCTFREGTGHIPEKNGSGDGKIRILSSKDGKIWKSVALLEKENLDLRDPKLSITSNGKLMVNMGGSNYNGHEMLNRLPFISFYNPRKNIFSDPQSVNIDNAIKSKWDWLWRVTWYGNIGYGVVYQDYRYEGGDEMKAYLVKTNNGVDYSLVTQLEVTGQPNEATVRFKSNGEMFILMRREGGDKVGYLGNSKPPYEDWSWKETDYRLGGPNFIFISDNKILVGTRIYSKKGATTGLFLGGVNGDLNHLVTFPSGGDTSYPGLIVYDNKLWVSYYSTHEDKTSIYLAEIPFKNILSKK